MADRPDDVKGSLPPARAEQARTTAARRAVIAAARDLFAEQGFATTTIGAIGERAGVPAPTLYRLFGSKLGVLKALLDTAIGGDDEPVPVRQRPEVVAALADPDPRVVLAGLAAVTTAINVRSNDVYATLVSAAGADADAARLLADVDAQRDRGQGSFARVLARGAGLRAGLRERDAADLLHGLLAPQLYRLLVVERGWTPRRYERWLADTLAQQLL